jgi:IS30 family transposase
MLTKDEVGQIAAAYREGRSTYELAKTHGVGRHTIARQLRRAGVTLRERNKR